MGLAPWDALHVGLSLHFGITFGQVSIMLGGVILVINFLLKEGIGFGTICNMVGVGIMVDMITWTGIIPISKNNITGVMMIIIGMCCVAFGNYWYVGSGFGAGPRDGLIIGLSRISGWPIGIIAVFIDALALLIGYVLGAKIGIGTLFIGLGLGPTIQGAYHLFGFDENKVKHRLVISDDDYEVEAEVDEG